MWGKTYATSERAGTVHESDREHIRSYLDNLMTNGHTDGQTERASSQLAITINKLKGLIVTKKTRQLVNGKRLARDKQELARDQQETSKRLARDQQETRERLARDQQESSKGLARDQLMTSKGEWQENRKILARELELLKDEQKQLLEV